MIPNRTAHVIAALAMLLLAMAGHRALPRRAVPAVATDPSGFPDQYLFAVGAESAPGLFPAPTDIGLGPDGQVYVTDAVDRRVQVFSPQGQFVRLWGGPGGSEGRFADPRAVAVAASGGVYVADAGNSRLQVFDGRGRFLASWDSYPDPTRAGREMPVRPADLAVAPDGTVLVADWYSGRILVFDAAGRFVRWWGGPGRDDGQFAGIAGISVAADGRVYVAEEGRDRIQYFGPEGTYLGSWTYGPVRDIAASAAGVAAVGGLRFGVAVFDRDGALLEEYPRGEAPADLVAPERVAFGSGGALYVLDGGGPGGEARIVRLVLPWAEVAVFPGGRPPAGVIDPAAVALDLAGQLYVADREPGRVQVFEPDGRHRATWSAGPEPTDNFGKPVGIAVDVDGTVFVADEAGQRVLALEPDGRVRATFGSGPGAELGQFGDFGPGDVAVTHVAASQPRLVYVADPGNSRVQAFDYQGQPQFAVGRSGAGEGEFCQGCVGDVATSPRGWLYVTESTSQQRVLAFDWHGEFRLEFQGFLGEDSRFAPLEAIAYAPAGRLYLSDPRQRIQVFTPDGGHLGQWDTFAIHPGLSVQPGDIVAGTDGRVYVADRWQQRVHVFGPERLEEWRLTAFANSWLAGPPVIVQAIPDADFALDWGSAAPDDRLPLDDFSVRLERFIDLAAGRHRFEITVDGLVRLWMDERLVIDEWREAKQTYPAEVDLDDGPHALVLEYADTAGGAELSLAIDGGAALPTSGPTPGSTPGAMATIAAEGVLHLPFAGKTN